MDRRTFLVQSLVGAATIIPGGLGMLPVPAKAQVRDNSAAFPVDASGSRLLDLIDRTLHEAARVGADAADAILVHTREVSASMQMENSNDSSRDVAGIGCRVVRNGRFGFAHTENLTSSGLRELVQHAIGMSRTSDSPGALNLAANDSLTIDLDLLDPAIVELTESNCRSLCEQILDGARGHIHRRMESLEAFANGGIRQIAIGNSRGLRRYLNGTFCQLGATATVADDGHARTGYWFSQARHLNDLEDADQVGRTAVERSLAQRQPRPIAGGRYPVIFGPEAAAVVLGDLARALDGHRLLRGETFLRDLLGEELGSQLVNIVDDGLLPRGIGSAPFDAEGVSMRTKTVFNQGLFSLFFYDLASAEKADTLPTGNAAREYNTLPGVEPTNLYLVPGVRKPADLVVGLTDGLYVTDLMAPGTDPVTGRFLRGARGHWIRGGEQLHAVNNIKLQGDLKSMLNNVDAVADDLSFRGPISSPSFRIAELEITAG